MDISMINCTSLIFCLFIFIILPDISYCDKSKVGLVGENSEDCDFHITVIRQFENDGFHREIHSLVELVGGYGVIQRQHCSLAMRENLPSGLYVSPDQLEDLARLAQVQACAESSVDIEAPEPLSTNLSVLVYSGLMRTENLLSAQLMLPVHARYHAPSADAAYSLISVGSPELYLRCAGRFNCPKLKTALFPCYPCADVMCTWMQLPYKTNAESLNMLVPVGNQQHYFFVTCLTFIITAGGAIYILSVLANNASQIL